MNILIPMAGAGSRFVQEGYTVHKPAIVTRYHRDGKEYPMVVCATMDLPEVKEDGSNIIYIDRNFHKKDGVEDCIKNHYPQAHFISIDYLTEGQASTCLLAKELINNDEELLIAGCDNGMIFDKNKFENLKKQCDSIIFTYRNNEAVCANPNQYGWVRTEGDDVIGLSVKKAISDTPMNDHAIGATFWYKKGSCFVEAAEKMIRENDRINNEFYVDQVAAHLLELGYKVKVLEIDRYIGWGTPRDYEHYMKTFDYWEKFVTGKYFLGE